MLNPPTIARAFAGLLLLAALLLVAVFVFVGTRLPEAPPPAAIVPSAAWPEPTVLDPKAWLAIRGDAAAAQTDAGSLANRYRLAGTFFLYGNAGDTAAASRRAIVDDLKRETQLIVREGDALEEYAVARVFPDRIVLRAGLMEVELALSYAGPASAPMAAAPTGAVAGISAEDLPALESSRFGKRVGDNRWVLQRSELLSYYREVLEEPERIAALYLSLKPDYQKDEVAGYRLGVEGESAFFQAAGLQENDVIRKVNSMRMVSQRRAEYFMSEFLKDRVSALVLDIEREGKPEKLIYLIR